jgi:hypothetical protein
MISRSLSVQNYASVLEIDKAFRELQTPDVLQITFDASRTEKGLASVDLQKLMAVQWKEICRFSWSLLRVMLLQ